MSAITSDGKAKRNAYAREWRKQNPEKVKLYAERYWNKVAEKGKELMQSGNDSKTD